MQRLSLVIAPLLLVLCAEARPSDRLWPVICSSSQDGFAVFVPHPTDCTLYYECADQVPVLMACPQPLFFDPSLNVCNWPDQVDCVSHEETTTEVVEEDGGARWARRAFKARYTCCSPWCTCVNKSS